MIYVALSTVGGVIGMAGGHYVYDTAKLVRREMRRKRKLAKEVNSNG